MQFLLIGYDGTDAGALDRRMAAREAHLNRAKAMKENGMLLVAAALLSDEGTMIGSCLVLDLPERSDLEDWLQDEPYVVGQVWKKIEVKNCRLAPGF